MNINQGLKRLYRNRENRILFGVMSGFVDYFDIDPIILRLLWLLVTIFNGLVLGVILYLFAAMIIPSR